MAEQYSPYTVADPFLSRPEIASRRLYWTTQNDFAAGQRANFHSSSPHSTWTSELGGARFAPGARMGAVSNAGINPNFNRRLAGPNQDIRRAQSAIGTLYDTVQGARGAMAVGRASRAIARGNAANQQAQNTLAGLHYQDAYLDAALQNHPANTFYGGNLPMGVKQSLVNNAAANASSAASAAAASQSASQRAASGGYGAAIPSNFVPPQRPIRPNVTLPTVTTGASGLRPPPVKPWTSQPSNPGARPGATRPSLTRPPGSRAQNRIQSPTGQLPPTQAPTSTPSGSNFSPLNNPNVTGVAPLDWNSMVNKNQPLHSDSTITNLGVGGSTQPITVQPTAKMNRLSNAVMSVQAAGQKVKNIISPKQKTNEDMVDQTPTEDTVDPWKHYFQ